MFKIRERYMPEQQLLISEEQIITPLVEVLDRVSPHSPYINQSSEPLSQTVSQSLDTLFPEQKYEEKDIQKAKDLLGELADSFTPEQMKDVIAETKYLVETWLDDFEREIFSGKTLQELLHEKGSL